MVLIRSILTENPCYKAGKKITPTTILLMGVRSPQPSARVFAHNWNNANCENRCVHAFIDANDGTVVQTLPWNHRGRLTGKHPTTFTSPNGTCIGIKMCEPSQIRYKNKKQIILAGSKDLAVAAVRRAYESAVELCAMLCKEFNIDPKTGILSQREGYSKGLMAQHSDPEMLWKALETGYSMSGFRADVMMAMCKDVTPEDEIDEEMPEVTELVEETAEAEPEPATQTTKVQVNVENLRIRSSPGVGNNTTGKYTGKGVFEIVEIQNGTGSKNGWGRLSTGGWISLDYVKML